MKSNSDNPRIGNDFQKMVLERLELFFDRRFQMETPIPIGDPPKDHRFDCVSEDRKIVAECKCYTWTDTGNIPSAKLMGLNEALFYMSYLPEETIKILCVKRAEYPTKKETLAEYYCRIDAHLLRDVKVFEIDDYGNIRIIKE